LKNTILTFDTETIGLDPKLVYDFGYVIHDKAGNVFCKKDFLIKEIFTDATLMNGAYFKNKTFSFYIPQIQLGFMRLVSWFDAMQEFKSDIAEFNVTTLAAYNIGFDFNAMAETNFLCGSGKVLEKALPYIDIWQFACETLLKSKTYKKFATDNGWISSAGNIKTGAEFAYRYICNDPTFIENHTALDDAEIETEILTFCFDRKKKIPYNIKNGMPWQIVNPNSTNFSRK
jgi:DNA polymerase III epsilon subunit-like protein